MSNPNLLDTISARQATVAVIGLGYVGLPLAIAFAEAGFRVIGIDVDPDKVAAISRGESYVTDVPSEQVATLVAAGSHQPTPRSPTSGVPTDNRLSATTSYDALWDADAVIICVPTPLGKTKEPDMSHILDATAEIAQRLHPDMVIVLESTTYPGTTEELILPQLGATRRKPTIEPTHQPPNNDTLSRDAGDGRGWDLGNQRPLHVGRDFFLAFSPERIDPGRKDYTIRNTPKVIGGVTPTCTHVAQELYQCVIEQVVPVSSPRAAEMVKLLENTFRAVNIALVNEVAIMCDRLGIDVWEVIEAAETKPFGFMPFYPGPGLGGHCIPIDPEYLAWKLKTLNYNARFIQLAGEINFGMPDYVLDKIVDALNEDRKPVNGSRVLILGVAYKADVGDLRESPALDLIHLLQEKGADVAYHDPYVPRLNEDGIVLTSVTLDPHVLQTADCVVITAAHSTYDWEWIVQNSHVIVDTRNATCGLHSDATRIVKL